MGVTCCKAQSFRINVEMLVLGLRRSIIQIHVLHFSCWDSRSVLIKCWFNHCGDPVLAEPAPRNTWNKPLADYIIQINNFVHTTECLIIVNASLQLVSTVIVRCNCQ